MINAVFLEKMLSIYYYNTKSKINNFNLLNYNAISKKKINHLLAV